MEKEGHSCCCCCEQKPDEKFLSSLDEQARQLILDDSTAPELISSSEEVFGSYERHELPPYTEGVWRLYKEIVDTTFAEGWDNATHPWSRDMQDFWKYPIAFASYGMASLVMTDHSKYEDVCATLRKSVQLMKEAGAFDEWTRLEFGKDPVTTKNVMYKGHLNLMYGLYQLITSSTEFEEEYRHLNSIITTEVMNNARDYGFWGIECEPDQYFSPCNSIAMLSEKVYDLNFGTDFMESAAKPTADFIVRRMVDPESGLLLFRYHPSVDYVEPYTIGDCWGTTNMHYFAPAQMDRAYEAIKREFLHDIKGGKECYLKANRFTFGASTDYEQSTWLYYVPFATREFDDRPTWEKINRFLCDMYGVRLDEEGVARFTEADPTVETHVAGYLMLGCVHLGWDRVMSYDWAALRAEMGR